MGEPRSVLTERELFGIRNTFGRRKRASNVSFEFHTSGSLSLQPPIWDSGQPLEHVLNWYEQRYGPVEIDARVYPMTGSILGKAQLIRAKRGGCGIRARTLAETEAVFPGIRGELAQVQGRVLFLGNGLSDIPLKPAKRFKRGELTHPPTMVDMFSYQDLLIDFTRLDQTLQRLSIDPATLGNYRDYYQKLSALVLACDDGSLKVIEYFVGSDKPPQTLMDSSLIVNCYGPSGRTLPEQLSFLAPGGRLFTTLEGAYVPPGYRSEYLGSGATKITRIA